MITNGSKWEHRFLDLAKLVASWSKDPSTKVGAVITREDRTIVSVGYNGFPRGMPDEEHSYLDREDKLSRVIHAEVNASISARESLKGCTLYTWPFLSCDRCFVQLAQAGITTVIAPTCPREKATSWEPIFEKVRRYADEMGLLLYELEDYT